MRKLHRLLRVRTVMALEPDPKADYKGKVQGMSSRGREKGAKLKMEYRQYGTKFLR